MCPRATYNQRRPNSYFATDYYLPMLWGTEWVKESSAYLCTGQKTEERQNGIRYERFFLMTTSLEDRIGFAEKMAQLEVATPRG